MNSAKALELERRNLRIKDFVKIYGIGRTKIYQEIKLGHLKPFKCGRVTLISIEAAERWQSQNESGVFNGR